MWLFSLPIIPVAVLLEPVWAGLLLLCAYDDVIVGFVGGELDCPLFLLFCNLGRRVRLFLGGESKYVGSCLLLTLFFRSVVLLKVVVCFIVSSCRGVSKEN